MGNCQIPFRWGLFCNQVGLAPGSPALLEILGQATLLLGSSSVLAWAKSQVSGSCLLPYFSPLVTVLKLDFPHKVMGQTQNLFDFYLQTQRGPVFQFKFRGS